ncbi:MAG: AsmA-like C-terminal region-containing protein, partial [Candidatus Sumerlaeia bacterium]|nr:AsmA-like C-terminal region-containing protein [Candidatus Sumerlaeia bacterium]
SLTIRGAGDDLNKLTGEGKFTIVHSRFINNPIFLALAEATRVPYFKDISFADVSGEIAIANREVIFKNTIFQSSLMRLMAEGSVGFDEKLRGEISLAIFSGMAQNLPLIGSLTGKIFQYIESYGSYVAKLKMNGTLSEPKFTPIPLSLDEVKKLPATLLRYINRLHPF